MSLILGTLCLNEMEWLPRLYEQHKDWPDLCKWIFVESADKVYAETNPHMVSSGGLSGGGTTEYLQEVVQKDERVIHVRDGFSCQTVPEQCKVKAREGYLDVAYEVKPGFVYVLDADEFYSKYNQASILRFMRGRRAVNGFVFKQRHIWHPPCLEGENLFNYEVVGGYWDVPHARGWRWRKGMHYRDDHNTPYGYLPTQFDKLPADCLNYCCHMGFAPGVLARMAKHKYYVATGDGAEGGKVGKRRAMYVRCRSAYESWQPGKELPHGARVITYAGI